MTTALGKIVGFGPGGLQSLSYQGSIFQRHPTDASIFASVLDMTADIERSKFCVSRNGDIPAFTHEGKPPREVTLVYKDNDLPDQAFADGLAKTLDLADPEGTLTIKFGVDLNNDRGKDCRTLDDILESRRRSRRTVFELADMD